MPEVWPQIGWPPSVGVVVVKAVVVDVVVVVEAVGSRVVDVVLVVGGGVGFPPFRTYI